MTTENRHTEQLLSLLKSIGLATDNDMLTLVPLPSRGFAARGCLRSGASYFVKMASNPKEVGETWLANCLQSNLIAPSRLAFRPKTHFQNAQWLITDFVDNTQSFKQSLDAVSSFPLASPLGHGLASLHSIGAGALEAINCQFGPGAAPHQQINPMGPLSPQQYADSPGLDRDLFIRTCQQSRDGHIQLIEKLKLICPVHGDLHGGNLLVDTANPTQFYIVDWDRAGLGDPAWDLGTLFAAVVQRWISHADTSLTSLPALLGAAQPIWDGLVHWFTEFLLAYWRSVSPQIRKTAIIEKIILVAGHALLQRSRNILSTRGQFSPREILTLSLAGKFLQQPELTVLALVPTLKEIPK